MNCKSKPMYYGPLMMLLAAVCFSTGGILIKWVPWNGMAINGARNVIAALVIGGYILITRHKIRLNMTVLAGAVCMFGCTTLFTVANKLTTAGNAIVIQYTAPVWIILLMFLFFHQKPTKKEVIAVICVLAGILFFFYDSISAGNMTGNLAALLAGIFYAGLFMLNSFEKGDALSSMFFGQLSCGILLTPLCMKETEFSMTILLAVFVLGFLQVGVAYILFSEGTKYTGPVAASLIGAVEPILNPILVAVFWGETFSPLSLVGAVIVLAAVVGYQLIGMRGTAGQSGDE